MAGRAATADEQWIDFNAQDDEAWYAAMQRDYGVDTRPKRAAGEPAS